MPAFAGNRLICTAAGQPTRVQLRGFAQSVMLGLVNEGLGSCPQTALSFHAGTLRDALGITDGRKLMFGMSFGRPIEDSPVNQCRTARADFGDLIQWHTDVS